MIDDEQRPLGARFARLWKAADARRVPLRTIVVAVVVVVLFFLAGKLVYRLRDVVLLVVVSGFIAILLNPLVLILQRYVVRRRGFAVSIVTLLAVAAFLGLAFLFGYPLVNATTHFANRLPEYVASVQTGRGWLGHLATKYHVQHWVSQNAPKLVTWAQGLSKPVLSFGSAAASVKCCPQSDAAWVTASCAASLARSTKEKRRPISIRLRGASSLRWPQT